MEFKEAMKITKRMCKGRVCSDCPLGKQLDYKECTCCTEYCSEYPEEAEEILKEWAKEHPQKTILHDFLEKYPNTELDEDGFPIHISPYMLGYQIDTRWDRPLEE